MKRLVQLTITHSTAKARSVQEGVVALLEPFIDTIVVCTMTALVIIITGATTIPRTLIIENNQGGALTSSAMGSVIQWLP